MSNGVIIYTIQYKSGVNITRRLTVSVGSFAVSEGRFAISMGYLATEVGCQATSMRGATASAGGFATSRRSVWFIAHSSSGYISSAKLVFFLKQHNKNLLQSKFFFH